MGRYNRTSQYRAALARSRRLPGRPRHAQPHQGKMKILMLSPTPVAGVPFLLRDIINKYTEHECRTVTGHPGYRDGRMWDAPDVNWSQISEAAKAVSWADAIMLHNGARHPRTARLAPGFKGKRLVSYYHSEPHRVDRRWEQQGVPAYVIAQGHALLYKNLPVLPNLVDIFDPLMMPPAPGERPDPCKRFIVAYSPSNTHSHAALRAQGMPYSSKGYPETKPILDKLARRGDITIRTTTGQPFRKCMKERRMCHIILDEVVTGSYHRCTLEACSHGQLAINAVSKEVRSIVESVTGSQSLPWLRCKPQSLAETIIHLRENPCQLSEMMADSRKWAEAHWRPDVLVKRYFIPALQQAPVWS